MREAEVYKVLKIIFIKLEDKTRKWRLEGSTNLLVQGMDLTVNDIDITTNLEGMRVFKEALKEFLVKEFYNEKVKARSLVFQIEGFEVEINHYDDDRLNMLTKIKRIMWRDLKVPTLPLEFAQRFYEMTERKEKAGIIKKHMLKEMTK